MERTGKGFYLLVAAAAGLMVAAILSALAYLLWFRLRLSTPAWITVSLCVPLTLLPLWVLFRLSILLLSSTGAFAQSQYFRRAYRTVVQFFPLVILLGRILRIDEMKLRRSFLQLNNDQVRQLGLKLHPDRVLLLLPHCLQASDCAVKITHDVSNCKRCGKCLIDALLAVSQSTGVPMAVATGGTLARQILRRNGSEAVVAVACERDLTDGILDTYPLPALGVVNDRPFGPCLNTEVDLERVEEAIRTFVH